MFRRRGLKISVNSTYASLKRRNIKRHLHFVIIIAYNIQVIGKLSPSMLFAGSNFLKTYRGKNRWAYFAQLYPQRTTIIERTLIQLLSLLCISFTVGTLVIKAGISPQYRYYNLLV